MVRTAKSRLKKEVKNLLVNCSTLVKVRRLSSVVASTGWEAAIARNWVARPMMAKVPMVRRTVKPRMALILKCE